MDNRIIHACLLLTYPKFDNLLFIK